jgi:hypothetical protein
MKTIPLPALWYEGCWSRFLQQDLPILRSGI